MKRSIIPSIMALVAMIMLTKPTYGCFKQQHESSPSIHTPTLIINIIDGQGTVNIFIPNQSFSGNQVSFTHAIAPHISAASTTHRTPASQSNANQASPSLPIPPSLEIDGNGVALRNLDITKMLDILRIIAAYTINTIIQVAYIVGDIAYTHAIPMMKTSIQMFFDVITTTTFVLNPFAFLSAFGTRVYAERLDNSQNESRKLVVYDNGLMIEDFDNNAPIPAGINVVYPSSIQEVY